MSTKYVYKPMVVYHPGVFLSEKLTEEAMSVKEFALRCQKPEKTIHDVLRGSSSITPDMALLFEDVLKISAHFWLNAQANYDEFCARKRRAEERERDTLWMQQFPVDEMLKKGYIKLRANASDSDKTQALLSFFGFAKSSAWEAYYQQQTLCTAFHLSLAGLNNRFALSAWLRFGEIVATKCHNIPPYAPEKMSEILSEISEAKKNCNDNTCQKLIEICNTVGIILVFAPKLQDSKAIGATRWLNGHPLIQIASKRCKTTSFWLTLFHEIGHIILHNKKEIFLEGIDYPERSDTKEQEADLFAQKHFLTP